MGCDIHEYFETRNESGEWHSTFSRSASQYWWEYIVEDMLDNGAGATLTFSNDPAIGRKALLAEFQKISPGDAVERYGHRPDFQWEWDLPILHKRNSGYDYAETGGRSYEWFGRIAGVRQANLLIDGFEPRGVPEDVSEPIRLEYRRWLGDAHTASWLMVSEILQQAALKGYVQYEWLKKFIEHPDRTRMVFWFDN